MNDTYNQYNHNQSRTLSGIGAVAYAAAVSILSVFAVLCLYTDAENAVLCFLFPVFLFAAGYFASALLSHSKTALFCVCALTSLVCCAVLSADILRSVSVLGVFGVAAAMKYATDKKRFTQSGIILIATAVYSVTVFYVFCVLCYQKYGSVGIDSFSRAYDSFTSLILKNPTEVLEDLKLMHSGTEYEDVIESYSATISLLKETLSQTVYFIPSAFLCICAIGGFITVRGTARHRRMQALPDTIGEFSISIVTAVLYIAIYFVTIFTAADSPLGITLSTVGAIGGLGLSLYGFYYIYGVIKTHEKRRTYTAVLAVILFFFTSLAQTVLALFGAYRTVFLYKINRDKEKNGGNSL